MSDEGSHGHQNGRSARPAPPVGGSAAGGSAYWSASVALATTASVGPARVPVVISMVAAAAPVGALDHHSPWWAPPRRSVAQVLDAARPRQPELEALVESMLDE